MSQGRTAVRGLIEVSRGDVFPVVIVVQDGGVWHKDLQKMVIDCLFVSAH